MAKRKKCRKTSRCPDPINTMLDIAGGVTMGIIAAHMENKYHYSKKGKINPYTVSAIGIGTGSLKTTKDLLRTGAILGALGSFDVEADDLPSKSSPIIEKPVIQQNTKPNNNRYAWRLNAEEGALYGVSPNDYETRQEYHVALANAKKRNESNAISINKANMNAINDQFEETWTYLRISRLDNGVNEYYRVGEKKVKVGDIVKLPIAEGNVCGVVLSIEKYTKDNAPELPESILQME